ncbi:T9SS type A sorting domain-containing protein [uncultured Polaribacter sp.]|uniref:T9SS type A sorting domain-containing protein n=1 Tax=uncultured Polaribacter sp. TaxID=174711 RepID=UPI0026311742|nr:T9SS type A sorting domain-containing protein [uncultured Polaribacter sp.]
MKKIFLVLFTTAITSLQLNSYNFPIEFASDDTVKFRKPNCDVISLDNLKTANKSLSNYYPNHIMFGYDTDNFAYHSNLKSNDSLADLKKKVSYSRKKIGNQNFNIPGLKKNITSKSLIDFLPETGMYKTVIAKVSSPKNLFEIPSISEVFSIDYYTENKIVSSLFASKTIGKIHDHSKVILNRLNNSSLEDISKVKIRGHQIISSKIKRATGIIEYTLGFAIKMDAAENKLFSFWDIDQYPAGNYQNYQIWGSSFSQVFAIANYIIDKHTIENGLKSTVIDNVLPNVFVKSGSYSNGVVYLNLVNKINEKSVDFVGNIAETEVSKHRKVTNTFALSGDYNEVLTIETGVLFDIGFSLKTASTEQKDALYLADGPWGLDYLKEFATVSNFDVNTSERTYKEDFYEVDRNVAAIGEVKGNINLFRHLLPGDQTLEVTDYEFLNFNITNNETVEIVIMQEEDRPWENRLRYTILPNTDEKNYSIPFSEFLDANGNKATITNIKTIVFSIIGDYTYYKPFTISLNELAFKSNNVLATDSFSKTTSNKLINYPNPFSNATTIQLPEASENITIQVFDYMGRVVDYKKLKSDLSAKKIQYKAPKLKRGFYKYRVKDDKDKMYNGTFAIN